MTYLSADSILSANDLDTEAVHVPEWGGEVLVRGLTGAERDRFEDKFLSEKSDRGNNFRAHLAAASMVDADGNRLFRSEAEVKRLGTKSAEALQRVCDVAMRLSGLTEADEKELTGN